MNLARTGNAWVLATLLTIGGLAAPIAQVRAQDVQTTTSSPAAPVPSATASADTLSLVEPDSLVAPNPLVELDPDALLVLEIRIERESSGHGVLAYQNGDRIMLPLGGIASILELALMVDPVGGHASGWIINEDRTFVLDLAARSVERSGSVEPLPADHVAVDDYDIYVSDAMLREWLPVDLDIRLDRMNVTISPREMLPFQARREREEQRERWLAMHGRQDLAYPLQVAPYRMWSWPMTNATLALNNAAGGRQVRFSSQSWADLGGLSSNLYLSHVGTEESSTTAARLKSGRWDPDGDLLGPLHATHYEAGDLYISRIPLITATKQGAGVTVSNQDLYRSREFDMTVVQGDATPGWEAELYVNGTLYDFQTIDETGRYVFEDVPMVVGNNTFRTVLYGPRGETRTVVDHANISSEMVDVGELKYTATLLRENASLLTSRNGADDANKPWNQQIELAYAFSNRSALVTDISWLDLNGDRKLFTSLTGHNSLGPVHLESIVGASANGGRAASLGARSTWRGHNLLLQSSSNDDYRAESSDGLEYISRQTIARASGTLVRTARRSLSYGLSVTNRDYRGSQLSHERDYRFRMSGNLGRMLLTHSFTASRRDYAGEEDRNLYGTQLLRTWVGDLSLRADLNYDASPWRLRSATATATAYRGDRLQATLRLNHFLDDSYGDDNAALSLTRLFDNFTFGVDLGLYESTGTTIGVTLGTFLARDNRSNTWTSTHRHLANRSAASVRTFVDLDNDGTYDNDDIPLEGVGFLNLTAWRGIRTNANGIALLPGMMVHQAQIIELDLATVSDPYLMPISEGVKVLGHPGGIVDVELPFAYAGEIEGMVVDAAHPDQVVRHLGLELLDAGGKRVNSAVSEFDGYYYFAEVLPGTYRLAVIPTTLNTKQYRLPEPIDVVMPGQGGFIYGPDIRLERAAARPEQATETASAATDVLTIPVIFGSDATYEVPVGAGGETVDPVETDETAVDDGPVPTGTQTTENTESENGTGASAEDRRARSRGCQLR